MEEFSINNIYEMFKMISWDRLHILCSVMITLLNASLSHACFSSVFIFIFKPSFNLFKALTCKLSRETVKIINREEQKCHLYYHVFKCHHNKLAGSINCGHFLVLGKATIEFMFTHIGPKFLLNSCLSKWTFHISQ